jgi:hypothetical protein
MKKKNVLKFMIAINLIVIIVIIWFAWLQSPKPDSVDSPEIKIEMIKLDPVESFKKPPQKSVPKQKKPEKKVKKSEKKPKKKVITKKPSKFHIYGLLSDKYAEPSLKFDTANPGNPDGGYLGAWGSAKVKGDVPDTYTDPPSSFKITCIGGWGGVWFQFGFDPDSPPGKAREKDMTDYGKYLRFDMKSDGEVIVGMEWWDDVAQNKGTSD